MNKTQALFIRACKSNNTERRLKRLYETLYYPDYTASSMMYILTKIVQEYNLIRLDRFILEYAHPDKAWQYGAKESDSYEERMVKALSSIIRLTEVSKLPDFIVSAKFRKEG